MNTPQLAAKQALRPATVIYQGEIPSLFPSSGVGAATSIAPACSCGGGAAKPACSCGGGGGAAKAACSCGGGGSNGGCSCNSTAAPVAYVYMIGSITPVFPTLSVEKEFLQAIEPPIPPVNKDTIPAPLSDAWYFQVLSKAENLYIAREMCWQLRKDKVTPYLLIPRSQNELVGMVAASAPTPSTGIVDGVTILLVDFDVVLGRVGPLAPTEMCNGERVPTIVCDESFNFTSVQYVDAIVQALKQGNAQNPPVVSPNPAVVSELFFSMMRMADNVGNTDSYRATNFLTVRYLQVYQLAYNMLVNNFQPKLPDPSGYLLQSINVQPAPVQGMQTVVDVVFSYVGQSTNTLLRWFCRVDVSGEFPFLVFPLAPYYGT